MPGEQKLTPPDWTCVKRLGKGTHQPTACFLQSKPRADLTSVSAATTAVAVRNTRVRVPPSRIRRPATPRDRPRPTALGANRQRDAGGVGQARTATAIASPRSCRGRPGQSRRATGDRIREGGVMDHRGNLRREGLRGAGQQVPPPSRRSTACSGHSLVPSFRSGQNAAPPTPSVVAFAQDVAGGLRAGQADYDSDWLGAGGGSPHANSAGFRGRRWPRPSFSARSVHQPGIEGLASRSPEHPGQVQGPRIASGERNSDLAGIVTGSGSRYSQSGAARGRVTAKQSALGNGPLRRCPGRRS